MPRDSCNPSFNINIYFIPLNPCEFRCHSVPQHSQPTALCGEIGLIPDAHSFSTTSARASIPGDSFAPQKVSASFCEACAAERLEPRIHRGERKGWRFWQEGQGITPLLGRTTGKDHALTSLAVLNVPTNTQPSAP